VERARRLVGEVVGRHLAAIGWCGWVLVARRVLRQGLLARQVALLGRLVVVRWQRWWLRRHLRWLSSWDPAGLSVE
jgi:hypothetical protein